MTETKIEPLKVEKEPNYDVLNIEVAKGVLIDGFWLGMSEKFAIIDGYIGAPRFKKDTLVSRVIVPVEGLKALQEGISAALKEYEKMCKGAEKNKK